MSKIKKASVATIASLSGLILYQQAHADVEKSSTKITTITDKIKFKQQIVQYPNMVALLVVSIVINGCGYSSEKTSIKKKKGSAFLL